MVDNRQVWRTKEECPFVEERGELGGAGFEQKSINHIFMTIGEERQAI